MRKLPKEPVRDHRLNLSDWSFLNFFVEKESKDNCLDFGDGLLNLEFMFTSFFAFQATKRQTQSHGVAGSFPSCACLVEVSKDFSDASIQVKAGKGQQSRGCFALPDFFF